MKNSEKGSVRAKKGEGSMRKTPSGSYEYRIRYTNAEGQRKTKTFTSKTIEGCFDKAEEFQIAGSKDKNSGITGTTGAGQGID